MPARRVVLKVGVSVFADCIAVFGILGIQTVGLFPFVGHAIVVTVCGGGGKRFEFRPATGIIEVRDFVNLPDLSAPGNAS